MLSLTKQAHACVLDVLQPGETAVDATAGNGNDTLFLAETVGPKGRVFAFDLQAEAIAATQRRCDDAVALNITLLHESHTRLIDALPADAYGNVGAVMFNLGYLPGGDKSLTTQPESTIAALDAAMVLLRSDGMLTVVVYPDHPGGEREADAVATWFESRENVHQFRNSVGPILYVLQKNRT